MRLLTKTSGEIRTESGKTMEFDLSVNGFSEILFIIVEEFCVDSFFFQLGVTSHSFCVYLNRLCGNLFPLVILPKGETFAC